MRQELSITLLFGVVLLSGCSNIYFLERTKAAVSVEVASDPSEPFELTAGYKRKILAIVPAQEDVKDDSEKVNNEGKEDSQNSESGTSQQITGDAKKLEQQSRQNVRGEALSLISRFEVQYRNDNIVGDVDLSNGFASGMAARNIAGNPKAVAALMGIDIIKCESEKLSDKERKARLDIGKYVWQKEQSKDDDERLNSLANAVGVHVPEPGKINDANRKLVATEITSTIGRLCTQKDVQRLVDQFALITGTKLDIGQ